MTEKTKYMEKALSIMLETLNNINLEKLVEIKNIILSAKNNRKHIFIIGNGGSSAIAAHFAADLMKTTNAEIKAISLVNNVPLITAISNDIGFDDIFSYQIDILGEKGDILIIFSVHGGDYRSGNLVKAVNTAKRKGILTISFVGFDGGYLKDESDIVFHIPVHDTGLVEAIFSFITHLITFEIRWEHDDISR